MDDNTKLYVEALQFMLLTYCGMDDNMNHIKHTANYAIEFLQHMQNFCQYFLHGQQHQSLQWVTQRAWYI